MTWLVCATLRSSQSGSRSRQRDTVRACADAAGMSVSRYGRHRLVGHGVQAYTDAATQRELGRIGGLIRHTYDAITAGPDPGAQDRPHGATRGPRSAPRARPRSDSGRRRRAAAGAMTWQACTTMR